MNDTRNKNAIAKATVPAESFAIIAPPIESATKIMFVAVGLRYHLSARQSDASISVSDKTSLLMLPERIINVGWKATIAQEIQSGTPFSPNIRKILWEINIIAPEQ